MALVLERCDFIAIRRRLLTASRMRNIETHGKHIGGKKIARFESVIFEGIVPA